MVVQPFLIPGTCSYEQRLSIGSETVLEDIAQKKQQDRERAFGVRRKLVSQNAADDAAANFCSIFPDLAANSIVSLYWPIRTELDTRPLIELLQEISVICALPCVVGQGEPLQFKRWASGDPLEKEAFGVMQPVRTAVNVTPDIVVTPLLAFDGSGARLGYGGGFYDRTLSELRQLATCIAVGYGYAGQEIPNVTTDHYDQKLDWVVTEQEARKFS